MVKPTVFVTGIAGDLGLRLVPQLEAFSVVGFDLSAPLTSFPHPFYAMDFGEEASCRAFYHLLRDRRPMAVVHLAFASDHVRDGLLDLDRMWRINVAGTARVMEAISEANRPPGRVVTQFVFPSCVSAYGPRLPRMVAEDHPLAAHTLPYAVHKMECDLVVQKRAASLRGAHTCILRPHIFAGSEMDNYVVGALLGTPHGKGERAAKRLPCLLPFGQEYLDHELQFLHPDDLARLIAHILKRGPATAPLTMLNVAGTGEPLSFGRCIEMAGAKLLRVPGGWAMRRVLKYRWKRGVSATPPEALPYMTGSCTMNTDRLRSFLGSDYETVMLHSSEDAFRDCLSQQSSACPP